MNFLLTGINAKYIHSNPALYSLRAYAASRDPQCLDSIGLAEYTINQQTDAVLADIYQRQPDVIGLSCYIWNWNMIRDVVSALHKIRPELPIWLGGPEVSYEAEAVMDSLPSVTGIMVGEGEETFYKLLQYYRQWFDRVEGDADRAGQAVWALADIKGIIYREQGKLHRTPNRTLTDISSLPFLYAGCETEQSFENRIIYYESGRGCPFRCSYCLSSIDKTVRLRERSLVYQELQYFLDRSVSQVKFVDRTFNCNHEHALAVWNYIGEHDNGVTNFHFEIAADLLDEEEVQMLNSLRPGLVQLEIGVQSTNPDTLRAVRRVTDYEKLAGMVRRLQAGKNVHIHLDLIAGLPLEGLDSFRESFNTVHSLWPEQLQLGFLKVLKGSHIYDMAAEYGIVYRDEPPYEILYTPWLSYGDILLLKKVEEMVELYYNSQQFTHTLPVLLQAFHSPFDMYHSLAQYFEENGYFLNQPSRSYRYHVLLAFARSKDPGREVLYKELLTLDMYLRENLKSRPDFASLLTENGRVKDRIAAFYRSEEKQPQYLTEYVQDGFRARQMQRMTHIELFTQPVLSGIYGYDYFREDSFGEMAVLFDYRHRNPLNGECRITVIHWDEERSTNEQKGTGFGSVKTSG